ncbi:UNVERIFIED_CONTAM: hypothetical protein K2H54_065681 [Gekko kuhli]
MAQRIEVLESAVVILKERGQQHEHRLNSMQRGMGNLQRILIQMRMDDALAYQQRELGADQEGAGDDRLCYHHQKYICKPVLQEVNIRGENCKIVW